jgi:hypothetical protein
MSNQSVTDAVCVQPVSQPVCQPFANDLDYLAAELDWIRIRAQRINTRRQLEDQNDPTVKPGYRRSQTSPYPRCPDSVDCLQEQEDARRLEIDSRLKLNRSTGPGLGLDRLCQEHALGLFERHLLLLAFLPCLGTRYTESHIWLVDTVVTSTEIYCETVSLFLELQPEDHLKSLLCMLPGAPLCRQGLVKLCYGPRIPADALTVGIGLTGKGLAAITGIPGFVGFVEPPLPGDYEEVLQEGIC